MPPKPKDKGGNKAKQGTQLKDILPPNTKPPREGEPLEQVEEPESDAVIDQQRQYEYLPYTDYPVWPGNQEVMEMFEKEKVEIANTLSPDDAKDYDSDKSDDQDVPDDKLYKDDFDFFVPPSFNEFERKRIRWLRPDDYLRVIANEKENKTKKLRGSSIKRRRKSSVSHTRLESGTNVADKLNKKQRKPRTIVNYKIIGYQERPETEEEMKKRKEEEEKIAGKEKKKPPKKGQEEEEEPQMVKVAIETNMDMGFLMPTYSKWLTSQIQFIKDRTIRD